MAGTVSGRPNAVLGPIGVQGRSACGQGAADGVIPGSFFFFLGVNFWITPPQQKERDVYNSRSNMLLHSEDILLYKTGREVEHWLAASH